MTPEYIKKVVERHSGMADLSMKSRRRVLSDRRHVYFALCFKYRITHVAASKAVNRDHVTSMHGVKSFNDRRNQNNYKPNLDLYKNCVKEINQCIKSGLDRDMHLTTLKEEEEHRVRFIELIDLRQRLVAKFVSKIDYLESVNKSLLSGLEVEYLTVKHTS